jgi:hypothetical protein
MNSCVSGWSTAKNVLCFHIALYIQKPNPNLGYTSYFIHTQIQTTALLYWANFHTQCITFSIHFLCVGNSRLSYMVRTVYNTVSKCGNDDTD